MKNKISVLLIDEDKTEQATFQRFLESPGKACICTCAGSVEEALQLLENRLFDVILSDINFIDGHIFDILPHTGGTPCIVTTARGYEEIAVMAIKKGASDYLVRDVEQKYLEILPTVIKKALNHKRSEDTIDILIGALKGIDECVAVFNPDGNIMFANNAFCSMFELKKNYYLSNISSILKKFHITGKPDIETFLKERKNKEARYDLIDTKTDKSGDIRLIPVEKGGNILGYVMLGQCDDE